MPLDSTNWGTSAPITEIDETTALLIRARGFIERGWCRGMFAQDASGASVKPTDPNAIAWCAGGALIVAGWPIGEFEHPAARRLEDAVHDIGYSGTPIGFNNSQETVEPILAAFDRAIADQGYGR